MVDTPSRCDPAWDDVRCILRAESRGPVVYVLGETDTGKTTLARMLAADLAETRRVAHLDADPGQSVLGPPACVAAAWAGAAHPLALRFVGAVTPAGHLLQTLTGVARLVERVRRDGAESIVIDSSGFVVGDQAHELQYQMIDLVRPDHLVALERRDELEALVRAFARRRGITCHRLPAAAAAHPRAPEERRRYRAERFAGYFAAAREQSLALAAIGVHGMLPPDGDRRRWEGRLAALIDSEGFALAMAVVRGLVAGAEEVRLLAPPFAAEAVASLQLGSMTLSLPSLPSPPSSPPSPQRRQERQGAPPT